MMPIEVIGLSAGLKNLPPFAIDILDRAQVLIGGRKLLDLLPDHPAQRLVIASPLEAVFKKAAQAAGKGKQVVVLASGDPLFYGIGRKLVETFGRDAVNIHPNLTFVQIMAARLKEPWTKAGIISLHGRGEEPLAPVAAAREPVYIYTDPDHSPSFVGSWLESQGQPDRPLAVAEALGSERERISFVSANEAAGMEFSEPNLVLARPQGDGGLAHRGVGSGDD